MKISSLISAILIVLSMGHFAFAQNSLTTPPECEQPLTENSNASIICNKDDRNLVKQAVPAQTQGGSPEGERPGVCQECEKNRVSGRMGDKTVAPAGSSGGATSAPPKPGEQ